MAHTTRRCNGVSGRLSGGINREWLLQAQAVVIFAVTAMGQSTKSTVATSVSQAQSSQPGLTIASAVDREISGVEKQVLDAAETMPEDKFNFSPESLSIPGDDYKGVRTFAVQVKHIAAPNYYLWSGLPGIAAGQPQGRERSGGREKQGRDPDVPAGFICAGSQGRSHVDNGEYVAGPGAQQIDAPAPGNLCRRPRL